MLYFITLCFTMVNFYKDITEWSLNKINYKLGRVNKWRTTARFTEHLLSKYLFNKYLSPLECLMCNPSIDLPISVDGAWRGRKPAWHSGPLVLLGNDLQIRQGELPVESQQRVRHWEKETDSLINTLTKRDRAGGERMGGEIKRKEYSVREG